MTTAATDSGPSPSIVRASSASRNAVKSSSLSSSGRRYALVFETWRTPGMSGSNGVFSGAMPVSESAPNVVPW
jgi:hypothetical protein